jgi:Leu/Phe-tRNA-protein transferase
MFGSMPDTPISPRQLARLSALIAQSAKKEKTSVTLSGNLLTVVDALAGAARRSAWIEEAVRRYAYRQLRQRRRAHELELLDRHAEALNAEGDDSASYQAGWEPE